MKITRDKEWGNKRYYLRVQIYNEKNKSQRLDIQYIKYRQNYCIIIIKFTKSLNIYFYNHNKQKKYQT